MLIMSIFNIIRSIIYCYIEIDQIYYTIYSADSLIIE